MLTPSPPPDPGGAAAQRGRVTVDHPCGITNKDTPAAPPPMGPCRCGCRRQATSLPPQGQGRKEAVSTMRPLTGISDCTSRRAELSVYLSVGIDVRPLSSYTGA